MSKSVMLSIQPKWCELVASRKKTIEVRKTKPKIDVPFKCYIYCTKGSAGFLKKEQNCMTCRSNCNRGEFCNITNNFESWAPNDLGLCQGKVIGEFVCDRIYNLVQFGGGISFADENLKQLNPQLFRDMSCLTDEQAEAYLNGKDGYGWHITDLKIYDKPKELREFGNDCKKADWKGSTCMNSGCEHFADYNNYDYPPECRYDGFIPLTRPPQSWCYVMEG